MSWRTVNRATAAYLVALAALLAACYHVMTPVLAGAAMPRVTMREAKAETRALIISTRGPVGLVVRESCRRLARSEVQCSARFTTALGRRRWRHVATVLVTPVGAQVVAELVQRR